MKLLDDAPTSGSVGEFTAWGVLRILQGTASAKHAETFHCERSSTQSPGRIPGAGGCRMARCRHRQWELLNKMGLSPARDFIYQTVFF